MNEGKQLKSIVTRNEKKLRTKNLSGYFSMERSLLRFDLKNEQSITEGHL